MKTITVQLVLRNKTNDKQKSHFELSLFLYSENFKRTVKMKNTRVRYSLSDKIELFKKYDAIIANHPKAGVGFSAKILNVKPNTFCQFLKNRAEIEADFASAEDKSKKNRTRNYDGTINSACRKLLII